MYKATLIDSEAGAPVLSAHRNLDGTPVATAGQVRAFLYAWQANDPNGTWSPDGLVEDDEEGVLTYEDEAGDTCWYADGCTEDGQTLYAIDTWAWSQVEED